MDSRQTSESTAVDWSFICGPVLAVGMLLIVLSTVVSWSFAISLPDPERASWLVLLGFSLIGNVLVVMGVVFLYKSKL